MKYSKISLLTLIMLSNFISGGTSADEINIEKLMKQSINVKKLPVPYEAHVAIGLKPKIMLKNIISYGGSVDYSEVKPAQIPESITTELYTFKNCSSSERMNSKKVAINYTEGQSITILDSIVSQTAVNIGVKIKSQALGMAHTRTVSFSKTETRNFTKTVSETVQLNEKIKPFTQLTVSISKKTLHAYLDFKGEVFLNGDVLIKLGKYPYKKVGRFQDFTNEKKPISLRGKIWNAKAFETQKSYYEKKLGPSDCLQH